MKRKTFLGQGRDSGTGEAGRIRRKSCSLIFGTGLAKKGADPPLNSGVSNLKHGRKRKASNDLRRKMKSGL